MADDDADLKRAELVKVMRNAGFDSPSLERDVKHMPVWHVEYLLDYYGPVLPRG